MRAWRLLIIASACLVTAWAAAARAAGPSTSSVPTRLERANLQHAWKAGRRTSWFAYEAHRATQLYSMAADGSDVKRLTHSDASDRFPSWSPDGSKIAFVSDLSDDHEIYVIAADGSDLRPLTFSHGWDGPATWSRDGSHIAFQSDRDGRHAIYVMTSDGDNTRRITDDRGAYRLPVWSPDGGTILCWSDRDGRPGLYLMRPDGTDLRWIGLATRGRASWAPDGARLALSGADDDPRELSVYTIDGATYHRVTRDGAPEPNPAWSPEGRRIAYEQVVDSNRDIYTIAPDGTDRRRLTRDGSSAWPAWSPDGKRIAYSSQREGNGTFTARRPRRFSPNDAPPPATLGVSAAAQGPTLRVLAAGVSREGAGRWSRRYGAADASDFAAACRAQAGRLYRDVQVRELTDAEATAEAVREGMAWLRDESKPGDVAFAFLSMHAVSDVHGDVYLCSADADPDAPIDGMPWSDVARLLAAVRSRLVVFADLHSAAGRWNGEMLEGAMAGSAPYDLVAAARAERMHYADTVSQPLPDHPWTDSQKMCLWPASIGKAPSVESGNWRNGAFTEALLIAMSDPATDYDADGILTELEVATVVARGVTRLTDGAQGFCPSQDTSPDLPLFAAAPAAESDSSSPEEAR